MREQIFQKTYTIDTIINPKSIKDIYQICECILTIDSIVDMVKHYLDINGIKYHYAYTEDTLVSAYCNRGNRDLTLLPKKTNMVITLTIDYFHRLIIRTPKLK